MSRLLQALLDSSCPLQSLDLSGTALCPPPPARLASDTLSLVCALICAKDGQLRSLSLRATNLCGVASGSDGSDAYSLECIALLAEALLHPNCVLVSLDLSENGIRAQREPQAPSRMPACLYGIELSDVKAMVALHPTVRQELLAHFGYPAALRGTSFDLLPAATVAKLDGTRLSEFWSKASQALKLKAETTLNSTGVADGDAALAWQVGGGFPTLTNAHTSLMAKHMTPQMCAYAQSEWLCV